VETASSRDDFNWCKASVGTGTSSTQAQNVSAMRRQVATCRAMLRFQYDIDQPAAAIQPAIRQQKAPVPSWSHPDHPAGLRPTRTTNPKPRFATTPIRSNAE